MKGKPGKPVKVMFRVFRKMAGCTVTIENAKGIDVDVIREALAAVLAAIDGPATQ